MTRSKLKGFTLIELMIVVAVIGILARIAYPSYLEHVRKGHRTAAQGALMENAQIIERFYTEKNSYNNGVDVAPLTQTQSPATGTARYTIQFAAGSPTASAYVLQAVPADSSDKCGTLTLNNLGVRGAVSSSGTAIPNCW